MLMFWKITFYGELNSNFTLSFATKPIQQKYTGIISKNNNFLVKL